MITDKMREECKTAVKNGMINEGDEESFLYCIALLNNGWEKHREIGKELHIHWKREQMFYENLKKSGYFCEGGMIDIGNETEEEEDLYLSFILMLATAEGYIRRTRVNAEEAIHDR